LELCDNVCGKDQYLLGPTLPYLENLHLSKYNIPTFVKHNPFGRIRCINWNNLGFFKMLFVKCSRMYQPNFNNNAKLKLKQKVLY
jgi:hypothetical protein